MPPANLTRVAGIVLVVSGAVGVLVLLAGASEVCAQLRSCGSEYATQVKQLRVVPVAAFVGLFGAGLLLTR